MTHSSSPLSEMPSPPVPPPEPPRTFTTKSMTEKSKSREDTIREALDKAARMKKSKSREDTIREALNKVRRRSKDRTSEFASHRSMSLRNMKRRSAGSTNDVMMKEGSMQNKFILSRSGKSSGALLSSSSSRWKDSPRTQHQRTNSGENNLLVKLELLMRNTRWFNQTWTPKRFEIQGGVLKVFRKTSTRAEETVLLSSCSIEALTAKKLRSSSSSSTTKKGMWSFKIISNIEDDRVLEVGSQDNKMLKQFHRLLKILSVSSQNFIPRHHIQYNDENVIGRGASGIVYKAQYFGTTVALKQLYDPSYSNRAVPLGRLQQNETSVENESEEAFLEEMVKELKLLSNFRHPNIISFLGVVFDAELAFKKNSLKRDRKVRKTQTSSTSIVMEFCPYVVFE